MLKHVLDTIPLKHYINTCMHSTGAHCSDGAILSDASEDLSSIRTARQTNREAARTLVTTIARQLHAQGAAEGREPLLLRGRYCVAVRANQRSAVSKGSVKLGASGTGKDYVWLLDSTHLKSVACFFVAMWR